MLAPISHALPPAAYGPWEQVCHDLCEGLVDLGHDVYLFAPAGSQSSAKLIPTVACSLEEAAAEDVDARIWEEVHIARAMEEAASLRVEVLHSHLHGHALGYSPFLPMPLVTTLHGAAWDRRNHPALLAYRHQPFVSLSRTERAFLPDLNYVATIGNGLRLDTFRPGSGSGGYLVYAGRMAPEKAPHLAIETARLAGWPLRMVGIVEERHKGYFTERVEGGLDDDVQYLGPMERMDLSRLLAEAAGLLMPLQWDEPFGLVVIESLAVGTPVIAWRRGAMPELVAEGRTGFLVDGVDDAVRALSHVEGLDRNECRREAETRFGHHLMAERYAAVYRTLSDHGGEQVV